MTEMNVAVIGYPERENKHFQVDDKVVPEFFSSTEINRTKKYDVIFLYDEQLLEQFEAENEAAIFVNSIEKTLGELGGRNNMYRVNHWPGFIANEVWEVAGNSPKESEKILASFSKKMLQVQDIPGFLTPRILSMIINEAYYAMEDGVSTSAEIDTAMQLGTNYPLGPIEWGNLIGLHRIHSLLTILAITDARYKPCTFLTKTSDR